MYEAFIKLYDRWGPGLQSSEALGRYIQPLGESASHHVRACVAIHVGDGRLTQALQTSGFTSLESPIESQNSVCHVQGSHSVTPRSSRVHGPDVAVIVLRQSTGRRHIPRGPGNGAISLDSGTRGYSFPGWLRDGDCVPWVTRWWIRVHSPECE